ncbi:MAG: hypothetical protein H0V51_07025 [Chloroflexi bacterium]|nr:hypothetical protein [Chloroflexota bacterium]
MPALKLDVDSETYSRLVEQAVAERRPVVWQAEVALRRALGLPFPYPEAQSQTGPAIHEDAADARTI